MATKLQNITDSVLIYVSKFRTFGMSEVRMGWFYISALLPFIGLPINLRKELLIIISKLMENRKCR